MKKSIMIGAGQIGRGFIGMELERAGYHVLFADINQAVIDDINKRGEYTVYMVDTDCVETVVKNISALNSLAPEFPKAFADSDVSLVCTSVGQTALSKVAPAIANGICLRMNAGITQPMNVIAVENAVGGTDMLKGFIYDSLDSAAKKYADEYIGFPNSAVDRIIPQNKEGSKPGDVVVERYFEWDVETEGLKADILPVNGMSIVKNLGAYLERKLFTLNGPNAVTAYYGYLKGYSTINDALLDNEIYDVAWRMMEECGAMLECRHGFTKEDTLAYRTKLMQRFQNPYIVDSVVRVAREPLRKLSPSDRIIAPMHYAQSYGIKTSAYYTGIAAALLYNNSADEQSQEMQYVISNLGVRGALEKICMINNETPDAIAIEKEYTRLHKLYQQ